ncbi:phytoene/squalene synthetase [Brevibacterium sanguinis]|uniref:Phytoene/squalene synthetase n=2 Tax=Brevibacterium TaxID=1696 RepID=A0A366II06_9MICO|nr:MULTISPECIES: squalene/phytoene synthase family protein [Brevibacterium]RBP62192.1 phytoene/squalene synthetase [Brevibacterium sanguinis]RBP70676.1 phytoene/squalene synthetase [Brevibacterium celere]
MTTAGRYDSVAAASASRVISGYSTSFGWATRLLGEPVRTDVRSIYALVRIADEIVDDPDPILTPELRAAQLDDLEAETLRALRCSRSANLVVHAFSAVARRCGIDDSLVTPFFASMRADLTRSTHDPESLSEYVFGSAEVVALMCLRAFTVDEPAAYDRLAPNARSLGAGLQKVNFLRDLGDDVDILGRTYFPGLDPTTFTDEDRDALLDDIDHDLAFAAEAIPDLPSTSRRAVAVAHDLFAALSQRLRRTPAAEIRRRRIRVSDGRKALIVLRAMAGCTA